MAGPVGGKSMAGQEASSVGIGYDQERRVAISQGKILSSQRFRLESIRLSSQRFRLESIRLSSQRFRLERAGLEQSTMEWPRLRAYDSGSL